MIHTINTSNGQTEIYLNQLDAIVEDFISEIDESELEKPTTFLQLLKHLYVRCFKPQKSLQFNGKSNLLNADPSVIEAIWDWYAMLALRFGRTPTVLQFCVLVGVNRHTFQDWREGNTRNATSAYSAVSEKMKADSEAFLESRAYESNSVGAIFGLKASHAWREASPIQPEIERIEAHDDPETIRQRHMGAILPEKPSIMDEKNDEK